MSDTESKSSEPEIPEPQNGGEAGSGRNGEEEFTVKDRRHWTQEEDGDEDTGSGEPVRPTIIDEYRQRAEAAEAKLQEYIDAFKQFRDEQDQVRLRLQRDIDRKTQLKFASLVEQLLGTVDNLDLALRHVDKVPEAAPLAEGVRLARDQFLAALERSGVEKFVLDGEAFDPNLAEAVRMDPAKSSEADGVVTETLQPGYRIGESLIRPARVAVGRA